MPRCTPPVSGVTPRRWDQNRAPVGCTFPAGPTLQRAAAEALGRIGHARGRSRELVRAASLPTNPVLEHSLTYALIDIGNAPAIRSVQVAASRARRVALIARDQIGGNHVTAAELEPLLASTDPVLRQTAWWIVTRHPEWGGELAGFFEKQLRAGNLVAAERDALVQGLAPFTSHAAVQQLLATAMSRERRLTTG